MATPYSLHVFDEVTSTQDVARSLCGDGPVLVVAHRQTSGRGRTGRAWENAPRAVAASYAFRTRWPEAERGPIPLVAGLAAAEILDVGLKWPNDLVTDRGKVGGLLVEASGALVIVGCGVNLWWPAPPPGRAGVHDADPGSPEVERFGRAWADLLVELLEPGPRSWPRERYRRRCRTLGAEITWEPEGRGRAVDVDASGGLVVETATGVAVLHSGEVHHVRARGPSG